MSNPPADTSRHLTERDLTALQGSLIAAFFVSCIETQRHWPTATGIAFLLATIFLLGLWFAYLTGFKQVMRHAAPLLDMTIISLLAFNWILSLHNDKSAATEMAGVLLFWSPLIVAWWTGRHRSHPYRLWPILPGLFLMPALLLWDSIPVHAHALLSLLIILAIKYPSSVPVAVQAASESPLRDEITDLASPEYFEAELAHLCAIADRYQMPVSLICCHLVDWFNEAPFADEDIRAFSDMLSERIRLSDTACHWEHGTFLVLLPNTTHDNAHLAQEKIKFALQGILAPSGRAIDPVMSEIQHTAGDDPMSTLSLLEKKMVAELEAIERSA